MEIIKATVKDVEQIAPLFDLYRQFYEQPSDLKATSDYLHDRLSNGHSIIFLAISDLHEPFGFTQLYPSFCSVEMIKIYVLYDLYVAKEARNQGVGTGLLDRVKRQAVESQVSRIDLQTAQDNHTAQKLYETFGYLYSDQFQNWAYHLNVKD